MEEERNTSNYCSVRTHIITLLLCTYLIVEVPRHDGVLYLAFKLHAFIVPCQEVKDEGQDEQEHENYDDR